MHVDPDHSTRRDKPLIHRDKLIKLLCPKLALDLSYEATYLINRPPPKKSHDQRLRAERTKHNRDPTVLIQMRNRLGPCASECSYQGDTAARGILIPNAPRIGDCKGAVGVALGRDVDVRLGEMQRRRSGEEDGLFYDEFVEFGHNFVVKGHHGDCRRGAGADGSGDAE